MEIKKVGNRGELFSFYDLGIATNVYVIYGKRNNYIIDTYLGPDVMNEIKRHMEKLHRDKPVIVINSHNHWDHVWGNSFFAASLIIGHEKCRECMQSEGLMKLEKYGQYKKGDITLTYPNLTFIDKLYFEEDEILIHHTPGHTADSISVLDVKDKVLFAGDNLERPIPYIMSKDIDKFISTLQDYLNAEANIIIGGHTACEGKGLIEDNLNYLKKVFAGENVRMESEEFKGIHKANLAWLKE